MSQLESDIRARLAADVDPYLGCDLVSAGAVGDIKTDGSTVTVSIELGFPIARYGDELRSRLGACLADLDADVRLDITARVLAREVQKGTKPLPEIRNIIAVASGKGGVGKSTTAANLAIALQQEGGKVGVLDADIYGPSQTRMLASDGRPDTRDGKSMEPRISYQLQTMSIGNLIEEDTPMIWRGPMVTGALEQLLNDTNWRDLDYLVVDLPPGTGDIQLTLCQRIPVSGAVIVTTPQDIALLDARKGLKMFEKVNVPVLGIVENMSVHICSNCGHAEHIFGAGGGEAMARQYGVELLGSLPLDMAIREGVDNGRPTVAIEPDSAIAASYREIARKVAARLALRARDFSAKFPKIVVQNT
ncbi:MAG: iron-sulfur cluster carrier protein ApbC [Gammaproteobacteria bacterium]